MPGGLLAGTKETPGEVYLSTTKKKSYIGMGSFNSYEKDHLIVIFKVVLKELKKLVPEGIGRTLFLIKERLITLFIK